MRLVTRFAASLVAVLLISAVAGCATAKRTGQPGGSPQRSFFQQMAERCGDRYSGRAIIAPKEDNTFRPAFLEMRIDSCTPERIRIAFLVDQDKSRTWILSMDGGDLVFTHEHMLPGDTLSSRSGWGGRAVAGSGTDLFQHFPDHRWARDSVPAKNRPHWRLRLDPERGQFVYYLDRGIVPLYRLVFHMGQDLELQRAR